MGWFGLIKIFKEEAMYSISVTSHFDAAHFLRGYPGKCARLHGHSWKYEVHISCGELDNLGMIVDFSILKESIKQLIEDKYDHFCLNDSEPFTHKNPTAENIAREIFRLINDYALSSNMSLEYVTVWESPECSASYWEE